MASSVTGWFKGAPWPLVGISSVIAFRIHDGAREDVRAGFRPFPAPPPIPLLAFFCRQLLQADRRGQTARAAADDDHVVFHGFAWAVGAGKISSFVMGVSIAWIVGKWAAQAAMRLRPCWR